MPSLDQTLDWQKALSLEKAGEDSSILLWRELQKLEHIRKVNGYFKIPAFTGSEFADWEELGDDYFGKSHRMIDFNYSAPSEFTIVDLLPHRYNDFKVPLFGQLKDVTFPETFGIICVRWCDGPNVYRYKLHNQSWNGRETSTFYYPLYNGQIIKRDFVIEMWTNDGYQIYSPSILFQLDILVLVSFLQVNATVNDFSNFMVATPVAKSGVGQLSVTMPETIPTSYPDAGWGCSGAQPPVIPPAPITYFNVEYTTICGSGTSGAAVTVAAATLSCNSIISQADADAKAVALGISLLACHPNMPYDDMESYASLVDANGLNGGDDWSNNHYIARSGDLGIRMYDDMETLGNGNLVNTLNGPGGWNGAYVAR